MSSWNVPPGPFDIPDVPRLIPRRLKPWLFIFFVLIIQFSGGVYLAAATQMASAGAILQQDVLMAGYAQLIGMSINFCVMFRLKFRFSNRVSLLACCWVLVIANIICSFTTNAPLLVFTCLVAGWFRMWATFACNSTIQLWITPKRDMAVFFCYVYLVVDGAIQLSGLTTVYIDFYSSWEYMHVLITALLVLMIIMVLWLVKPIKGPMAIPLLGIDWIGALLWTGFMTCFAFVCVYGSYYDWWAAAPIRFATWIGLACAALNLWRATILRHPYISIKAMLNGNVLRATAVYLVFNTLIAPEHVFEHGYAGEILGYDSTNLIDLNWYVMAGIVAGVAITYELFARQRRRYKTMAVVGFTFAVIYLLYFYFTIGEDISKDALAVPLFCRGAGSVIISIVFLTSIVQSGLPFKVFPQALTVNGFTGAVMGAVFGPAVVGRWLECTLTTNMSRLSESVTSTSIASNHSIPEIMESIVQRATIDSMKEIYGWLLIIGLVSLAIMIVSYSTPRPRAIFPTWSRIRSILRTSQ